MTFDLTIGGTVVRCSDHDGERADAHDRKAARRFRPLDSEVPGEVDAFCAALSEVPSLDYAIARAVLPSLPLPKGFRHFRLFRQGENTPFHRAMVAEENAERLTSRSVLFGVLAWPCMEVTSWFTTTRRPVAITGVLDLELDLEVREAFRPLRMRE